MNLELRKLWILRITITFTCVIVLLYLPVFITSPPWGDAGYYIKVEVITESQRKISNYQNPIYYEEGLVIYDAIYPGRRPVRYQFNEVDQVWISNDVYPTFDKITIKDGIIFPVKDNDMWVPLTVEYHKTSSPIHVWYSVWTETFYDIFGSFI